MPARRHLGAHELDAAATRAVEANPLLAPEAKRLIAKLYTLFRHRIGPALAEGGGDAAFWVDVIVDMLVTASKFKIEGVQRKAAVLEVLRLVIATEVPDDAKEVARGVVDNVVSPGIDLAIRFARVNKGCKKVLACCC